MKKFMFKNPNGFFRPFKFIQITTTRLRATVTTVYREISRFPGVSRWSRQGTRARLFRT